MSINHRLRKTTAGLKFSWTEEAVAKLTQMWADNMSSGQCAVEFGLTRNAIIGKVHRLGLMGRKCDKPSHRKGRPKVDRRTVFKQRIPFVPIIHNQVPEPDSALRVTFAELEVHHCRFPIGDPQEPNFMFCGANRSDTLPYCAFHANIVYAKHVRIDPAIKFAIARRMAKMRAARKKVGPIASTLHFECKAVPE